jgi:hypothetical protein
MNLELLKSLGNKKFDAPRDLAEWYMEQENRLLLIKNRQFQEEWLVETTCRRMLPRARKPAGIQGATATPRLTD